MLFLLDAQLPRALAGRIIALGYSALHMSERLPAHASDHAVAELANSLGAVLVSKDQDFVDLSARGVLEGQLLWIRSGNMTTRRLWALLDLFTASGPRLRGRRTYPRDQVRSRLKSADLSRR